MNKSVADALWQNNAHVSQICHIGYMALDPEDIPEPMEELISDFLGTPNLHRIFGLGENFKKAVESASTPADLCESLLLYKRDGFLIAITGYIYEQAHENSNIWVNTCATTSDLIYAHTAADIDQAILDALERLRSRLRRPAKTQES